MAELYCTIQLHGPFRWFGSNGDVLFTQEVAGSPGIYIWAVPYESGFMTYYVGETGRSFRQRMKEHVKEYFSGMYRVFDPGEFASGRKVLLWDGMWRAGEEHRLADFVSRLPELSKCIAQLLDSMRIFLGPLDVPTHTRRRIEAALAKHLYEQPGVVGQFQDSDLVYRGRSADQEPLLVRFCSGAQIMGLGEIIEA